MTEKTVPKRKTGEKRREEISRRVFLKKSAVAGTVTIAGLASSTDPDPALAQSLHRSRPDDAATPRIKQRRLAILSAMGHTLIPSAPGDPGYRDLEWYGITAEVDSRLGDLSDEKIEAFDRSSVDGGGRPFAEMTEEQRIAHLNRVIAGDGFPDRSVHEALREVYDRVRETVFAVYYQNFPEGRWPLDAQRVPLLRLGDKHQITNPNTSAIVTGWDASGYAGPLTWQEEERRRNLFKKIRWEE